MAERRNFLVSFSFPSEAAGEFFQLFTPFMGKAQNFECITVNERAPDEPVAPVRRSERPAHRLGPLAPAPVTASDRRDSRGEPSLTELRPNLRQTPAQVRRGNPATSEEARKRFRIDQRGGPTARDVLVETLGGKESFLIQEAIEALTTRGWARLTAAPTLNNMKARGEAEHLGTNRFRIKVPVQGRNGNGNGEYHKGGL